MRLRYLRPRFNYDKMKILTITTQYANNMGALLQCYALSRYINSLDNADCEVLQYFPKGHNRSWTIFHKPRSFRDVIKLAYDALRVDLLIVRWRKQKKMRRFISKYIPLTTAKYKRKDILSNPPKADAIVVGSDQIWNFKLRTDFTYFLDFTTAGTKRISYAASVADDWTEEQIKMISPIIKKFDSISIREKGNLCCVNAAIGSPLAKVVCDPVFLLTRDDWDSVKAPQLVKEPYIFCYFLSVSPMAVDAVKRIKELTGLKIVHLNLNTLDKFNSDIEIKDADPLDFVSLISHAAYVCTNSFHCSAFSIIYHRNLTFVPKHMANERITQLQEKFGINVMLTLEKLTKLSIEDITTAYPDVDGEANQFIEQSKQYLIEALYGKD